MAFKLSDLRTAARQRADMENSRFIQDTELNAYINASYAELYDILVSRFEDYSVSMPPTTFTISSGANTYPLPANFYKLKGLDIQSGSNWEDCHKYNFAQRNQRSAQATRRIGGASRVMYRIIDNQLYLVPELQAAGTYRIWFVPRYTPLVLDTDQLTNVLDFEEYIVVDAAIKCLTKEESDTSSLKQDKMFLLQRIEAMASNRDVSEPEVIANVMSQTYRGDGFSDF
jgi:hypothetical protein